MLNRSAARRGFTLIELLVVIAIIAVLAAIVLPVMNNVRERGRQTQCLANLAQAATTLKLYHGDYHGYPYGAVMGNQPGLPDDTGASPGGASYNTIDPATATQSRISALFPNYIEEPKSLICPDEQGASELVSPGGQINGADPAVLLEVGTADGSLSTYDDYYNTFGYAADGTPQLAPPAGFGRRTKALANRYASGDTIVSCCREHESFFDIDSAIDLIIRVDGGNDKVVRVNYDWAAQAQQVYD